MIKKILLIGIIAVSVNSKSWNYADISPQEIQTTRINLTTKFSAIPIGFLTFYDLILISREQVLCDSYLVHELTHTLQQRRDGLKFWFSYGLQFLINQKKYKDNMTAYEKISYEKQAIIAEKIYAKLSPINNCYKP